jgi:hypothetical protein
VEREACLVAIAPKVVLGADVLVRILDLFFHRRSVLCMLLVSIPSNLAVDYGENEARNGDTVNMSVFSEAV